MKKTIRFFALLAVAGAMTFAGCSKDDDDEVVKSETLQVTFGGQVIPMGWFDATFDGTYAQIEAAAAHMSKGSLENFTLPYAQMQFTAENIHNAYYSENANRIVDNLCEWAYDEDLQKEFSLSGFDATKLSIESAYASMTMYDYYAYVNEMEEVDEKVMTATATNITLELMDQAKAAKKIRTFQN